MSSFNTTIWKPAPWTPPSDSRTPDRLSARRIPRVCPAAEYEASETSRLGQPPEEESRSWFKPFVRTIPKVPAAPRTEQPVIGILVQEAPSESSGSGGSVYTTGGRTQMYADAVQGQGGVAHFIWDDGRPTSELLKGVHGLLIPGGPDLNPEMYGEEQESGVRLNTTPMKFDQWEKDVTQAAIGANVPTRGICRGHQLLNVLFPQGTLQQDIVTDQGRTRPYPYTVNHTTGNHAVAILPGSTLADIAQTDALMANSYHHQAVDKVGEGLKVTARSADGTVEGIENGDGSVVGVQFHPERDRGDLKSRFFTDFVTRANSWRAQHDPLSAEELAALMAKPPTSHQTLSADGSAPTRQQAIGMGLEWLRKEGYEMVYWGRDGQTVVTDKNIGDISSSSRCEVRGRKTHKLVLYAEGERRDEFLLTMTTEGTAYLPKDAQDIIKLAQEARDASGAKTGDLFSKGYRDRLSNPIEVVWAYRQNDLTFTPPNAPNTRIKSIQELQDCVNRSKARPGGNSERSW